MEFKIEVKDEFIKNSSILPPKLRKRISNFIFKILPDSEFPYGLFEKMTGFKNYYKKRFGDYRLGVEIDKDNKLIIILTIMHRKEIYRYFPPKN